MTEARDITDGGDVSSKRIGPDGLNTTPQRPCALELNFAIPF